MTNNVVFNSDSIVTFSENILEDNHLLNKSIVIILKLILHVQLYIIITIMFLNVIYSSITSY